MPMGNLVIDAAGNLYGTASLGGVNDGGTVFELTPSNGVWTFDLLSALPGTADEYGPTGNLALDATGNLYGAATGNGQYGKGYVFKLVRNGPQWTFSDLYDFTGGNDGYGPSDGVTLDTGGNIYGTTPFGGADPCGGGAGCGIAFEITN